jgi:DNA-binding MarR family transcriptional regulator
MNASSISSTSEFILKANKVKKNLLPIEGLTWTDLLVICTIQQLELTSEPVTTSLVIGELKMNKCWVYKSIRKLEAKNFILVRPSPRQPAIVCLSNWGKILLSRVNESFRTNQHFGN